MLLPVGRVCLFAACAARHARQCLYMDTRALASPPCQAQVLRACASCLPVSKTRHASCPGRRRSWHCSRRRRARSSRHPGRTPRPGSGTAPAPPCPKSAVMQQCTGWFRRTAKHQHLRDRCLLNVPSMLTQARPEQRQSAARNCPHLHCHRLIVDFDFLGQEVSPDSGLVLLAEFFLDVLVHQAGLRPSKSSFTGFQSFSRVGTQSPSCRSRSARTLPTPLSPKIMTFKSLRDFRPAILPSGKGFCSALLPQACTSGAEFLFALVEQQNTHSSRPIKRGLSAQAVTSSSLSLPCAIDCCSFKRR